MDDKVLEVYKNLLHTYKTMTERKTLVSDVTIFRPTRVSKKDIKRKITELERKYKLNNK